MLLSFDDIPRQMIVINNSFPSPFLRVNWGDWVGIYITNYDTTFTLAIVGVSHIIHGQYLLYLRIDRTTLTVVANSVAFCF